MGWRTAMRIGWALLLTMVVLAGGVASAHPGSRASAAASSDRAYRPSWAILPVGKHWMRIEADTSSSDIKFAVELRSIHKGGGVAAVYRTKASPGNVALDDLYPRCLVTRLPDGIKASRLRPWHGPARDAAARRSFAKKWLAERKKSECVKVRSAQ